MKSINELRQEAYGLLVRANALREARTPRLHDLAITASTYSTPTTLPTEDEIEHFDRVADTFIEASRAFEQAGMREERFQSFQRGKASRETARRLRGFRDGKTGYAISRENS